MRTDQLEELHFRVDEHERRFAEVSKAASSIPDLIQGGIAALHAAMKTELAQLRSAQQEDIESDRAVVAALKELIPVLREVAEALNAPELRESVVELPSGPVKMTVRKKREH